MENSLAGRGVWVGTIWKVTSVWKRARKRNTIRKINKRGQRDN